MKIIRSTVVAFILLVSSVADAGIIKITAHTASDNPNNMQGTGVLVSATVNGSVGISAHHVVDNGRLTTTIGKNTYNLRVLKAFPENDLAIFEVDGYHDKTTSQVSLLPATTGVEYWVSGFPMGNFTARKIKVIGHQRSGFIVTEGAFVGGISGGPLVLGNVIYGVVSQTTKHTGLVASTVPAAKWLKANFGVCKNGRCPLVQKYVRPPTVLAIPLPIPRLIRPGST